MEWRFYASGVVFALSLYMYIIICMQSDFKTLVFSPPTWFGGIILYLLINNFLKLLIYEPPMDFKGKGKAVFISGCDSGIGFTLAHRLYKLGFTIYAGCLDPDSFKEKLPLSTINVVPLDVTSKESVDKAFESVKNSLDSKNQELWGLVNNAGVCVFGKFQWYTWKQCEHQVNVNLLGTMRLTKAFLPLLRQSMGRIIVVTSVNGFVSYPGISVYCATKFGLEGFCNSLRMDLQPEGIKVIIVEPGDLAKVTNIMSRQEEYVQEMWENMTPNEQEEYGTNFRDYIRAARENYGLTSPNDINKSPVFNDIQLALTSKSPRPRYLSVSLGYSIVYYILGILPSTFSDKLIMMLMNRILNPS